MKLHLEIIIETHLKNSGVDLCVPQGGNGVSRRFELLEDSTQTLRCDVVLDGPHWPNSVEMCRVEGFGPGLGQKIVIKGIKINDRPQDSQSFFDLLDFSATGNRFVDDHVITNCHEICLNGKLLLAVARNRDRLFSCPYYYSNKKDDFVFVNSLLDEYDGDVLPYRNDPRHFRRRYLNSPHHEYSTDKLYDFACFGCSVTYGNGLARGDRWSDLLGPDPLNLAVPALGIDGIFLQVKNALEKFRFRKIIMLLPNFERQLVRLWMPRVDAWCRIPVTPCRMEWHHSRIKNWAWQNLGIQHDRDDLEQWKRTFMGKTRGMILSNINGDNRRGRRILDRLLRLCRDSGRPYYVASWDEEVQDHLRERVESHRLLPAFNSPDRPWNDWALDNQHPGPHSHRRWAELIAPLVKSQVPHDQHQ